MSLSLANRGTIVLGITGPSGSGKTEISRMIADRSDIVVLDADKIAHILLEDSQDLKEQIIECFSEEVLRSGNCIDRRKLGRIVFSDKQKLARLNEIMFPYIRSYIEEEINSLKECYKVILLDAPTLIESGLVFVCDKIVVVLAERRIRLRRILSRDGISMQEAEDRLGSQLSDEEYLEASDFVIYNNGSLDMLKRDLCEILNKVCGAIGLF